MSSVGIRELKDMYYYATKHGGLIDFIKQVRLKNGNFNQSIKYKPDELAKIFNSTIWKNIPTGSGHTNFESKLATHIHIRFSLHVPHVDGFHLEEVMNKVQSLLNIMLNEVFQNKSKNWSQTPDFKESLKRYNRLFTQTAAVNHGVQKQGQGEQIKIDEEMKTPAKSKKQEKKDNK